MSSNIFLTVKLNPKQYKTAWQWLSKSTEKNGEFKFRAKNKELLSLLLTLCSSYNLQRQNTSGTNNPMATSTGNIMLLVSSLA